METQVENSGLDVISKQEIDSKMPDEIAGGIIEPASVTIKKEIIDTELNPSVPDFENFIGNNDPINIKSEDIHTIIDNSHEEETYQHMMIGAEIMSEDESEEKTLHLKGEVIDMELENVKEEPAEKYSESSEDESTLRSDKLEAIYKQLGFKLNEQWNRPGQFSTPQKKYVCYKCDYQHDQVSRMQKHHRVHSEKQHQCEKCPFRTKYRTSLRKHTTVVHRDPDVGKPFACQVCAFRTHQQDLLRRHMITHSVPKEPKVEMYKCELCNFKSKKKHLVLSHVNIHRPPGEEDLYKCELCPYTSKFKNGVLSHMTVHKKPSETTMYECELCSYKTKWPHCLRNHLKTHKKKQLPVHKCEHCDFQANNKYSVATHKKSAHKDIYAKPKKECVYKCDICEYTAKTCSHLSRHKMVHDKNKSFTCALCGSQMRTKKSLKYHILTVHEFLKKHMESTSAATVNSEQTSSVV